MNLRPVWATEQDTVSTYPYSKKYSTFSTSPPMVAPITPPGLQIIVGERGICSMLNKLGRH